MSRDRTDIIKKERRTRIPMGIPRQRLTVDRGTIEMLRSKGLKPRWIKDDGVRVLSAIDGGYMFVYSSGKEMVGDDMRVEGKDIRIRYRTGTNRDGSEQFSYLMAISTEHFLEDKRVKEERCAMVDDAIRGGNAPGSQGNNLPRDKASFEVNNIQYNP